MNKLVKVEVAFDLMDKDSIYMANVNDQRTKGLIAAGYLSLVESAEELLVSQSESELEGAGEAGAKAPRSKSGKVST